MKTDERLPGNLIVKLAVIFEGTLISCYLIWSNWRNFTIYHAPLVTSLFYGMLFTLPVLLINYIFLRLRHLPRPLFQQLNSLLNEAVIPLCSNLNVSSAFIIGLLSGLGEELFFRAVLLNELTHILGLPLAVLISSVLFAYAHFVGVLKKYMLLFIYYTLFGAYFAVVALNYSLIAAITTHGLYNFVVILFIKARLAASR